jgi:putative sigma-54 modulation protein
MRVEVTGRHVTITPPLRQLIARRLTKLERLLNDSAISASVILTKEKYRHRAEIIVHVRGDHMLRGQGEGTGWQISVRDAAAKIEQQAQTLKGKWGDRRRRGAGAKGVAAPPAAEASPAPRPEPRPGPRIVRATRYAVKPMSVDDAVQRMESGAETFVVFRSPESDAVCILFRRTDGHYGLIEPD